MFIESQPGTHIQCTEGRQTGRRGTTDSSRVLLQLICMYLYRYLYFSNPAGVYADCHAVHDTLQLSCSIQYDTLAPRSLSSAARGSVYLLCAGRALTSVSQSDQYSIRVLIVSRVAKWTNPQRSLLFRMASIPGCALAVKLSKTYSLQTE